MLNAQGLLEAAAIPAGLVSQLERLVYQRHLVFMSEYCMKTFGQTIWPSANFFFIFSPCPLLLDKALKVWFLRRWYGCMLQLLGRASYLRGRSGRCRSFTSVLLRSQPIKTT